MWYKYRVDFDLHQKLENAYLGKAKFSRGMSEDSNYLDSASFMLNSDYTNLPSDATHTFVHVLASLVAANKNAFQGNEVLKDGESYISSYEDKSLVEAFKNGKIDKVTIKAGATSQDSKNSQTLAERRYRSVLDLIADKGRVDRDKFDNLGLIYTQKLVDPSTINSLEAKLQRFASVEMWYDTPESSKLSDTSHVTDESIIEENVPDDGNVTEEVTPKEDVVAVAATDGDNMSTRYETEAEYFRNIEKEHPFIYKNLVEKFKYFSPAYHSISPEGFNARLTFLQQCTRQGHTISATDLNYAKTAGNLSFGKMPVCVLRIGDFINTKIIINSMSINYGANGAPQWDLNPEGIGVQPMYAKVQLGISILGGQSLKGPVNRLQNAVSFNYYANTGVYDDRADRINVAVEKKVFSGTDEEVREITMETSGDKLLFYDESEYGIAKTVYENIWTPYPNVVVKDDANNRIGTYNEYKANGVEKGPDGKYRIQKKNK